MGTALQQRQAPERTKIVTEDFPWGKSHPLRGLNHHEHAITFARHFPIGTVIATADFEKWAAEAGLLASADGIERYSAEWYVYTQRRGQLVRGINQAAMNERIIPTARPFHIAIKKKGKAYEVQAVEKAIVQNGVAKRVLSLQKTLSAQMRHLMQCVDATQTPPEILHYCEELCYALEQEEATLALHEKGMREKAGRLTRKLSPYLLASEL